MVNRRRQTLKTKYTHGTQATCACGCLATVTGRQVFASARCRKAHQRHLDRLDTKEFLEKTDHEIHVHNQRLRHQLAYHKITREEYEKKLIRRYKNIM